ncbi:MAG: GGDEF domain-containing protein [Lachnospiraceae bacterium]|nr:GGDEF domain-containing protein [Lachnospiraceae bacterium]
MKKRKSLKERGISLKKVNIIMVIVALAASIVLFWAMSMTNDMNEATNKAVVELISLRSSAYELQIASDYLTEQIRCFAVSEDKEYLDNYFEEANISKRRDRAVALINEKLGDSTAAQHLNNAMKKSIELMDTEYYAARLTLEAMGVPEYDFPQEVYAVAVSQEDKELSPDDKEKKSVSLLFDEKYSNSKEIISKEFNSCINELTEIVEQKQYEHSEELRKQVLVEHILSFVLIFVLLGIVTLTSLMIFRPLKNIIDLIRDEQPVPVKGAYEIRFLAKTYNLMNHVSRESKEKLEYDATHDELTGLYNRRGYDFLLNNVDIDTSALVLIDLNEFKKINDTYGHDVGDRALIKVADVLNRNFRAHDFVCRIGGDEFAVIMIHTEPELKDKIAAKVKNINASLKADAQKEDLPPISLSAGVVFGELQHSISEIYKQADNALYKAKADSSHDVIFAGFNS